MTSTPKKFRAQTEFVRNSFRWIRRTLAPPLVTFGKLISFATSDRSYLKHKGFFKSAKAGVPIDFEGNPVPWMNYPIIDFFEERFNEELSMFEYGCGNSTLFYAKRLKHVTSLEGSQFWHDQIKPTLPENATLILVDPSDKDAYLRAINEQGKKYDIVLVDAEFRNDCAIQAINSLTPRGIIVYDDSQRLAINDPIFATFEQNGFKKLTMRGLKPGSFSEYASTIFYRSENCLNI